MERPNVLARSYKILALLSFLMCLILIDSQAEAAKIIRTDEGVIDTESLSYGPNIIAENRNGSALLIRLKENEVPHAHEGHDLSVVMIQGKAVLHTADKTYSMEEGDSAYIVRGDQHWAELLTDEVIVYAVKIYTETSEEDGIT